MRTRRIGIWASWLAAVFVLSAGGYALGVGFEYPAGKKASGLTDWPSGLLDLVNTEMRIHG